MAGQSGYYPGEVSRDPVASSGAGCSTAADVPYVFAREQEARKAADAKQMNECKSNQVSKDPVNRIIRPGYVAADRKSDPYAPTLTAGLIRRLAAMSPEADKVLRAQVPGAFSEVVDLSYAIAVSIEDGRMYVEPTGPYNGVGLHLDDRYTWEVVPAPYGLGQTLIARRSL